MTQNQTHKEGRKWNSIQRIDGHGIELMYL